jgi:hypothetical protein
MADEFTSPLRIFHSTKDSNGERRQLRINAPAQLVESMERFMRQNTTYLSLHQYVLNCLHYGQERLESEGMADDSGVFKDWLDAVDTLARLTARERLVATSREAWGKANSLETKGMVRAMVEAAAGRASDPVLAAELRRILE